MTKKALAGKLLLVVGGAAALVVGTHLVVDQFSAFVRGAVREAVRETVEAALHADAHNLPRSQNRIAARDTAQFITEHLSKARAFPNRFALLEHSLASVNHPAPGLYCEFGVYKGETINFIASKTAHTVHGFDSFEGLPETWRSGFETGTFKMDGLPQVRANVRLHKGWFDQSLPGWARAHPGPVVFMHQDADLYSSTKTVFDILGDRVVAGSVIQFDEFFNYPGWREGEYKAFVEFVRQRGLTFEYIGYTNGDNAQQVAVRILTVPPRRAE
jgi:hypothetical protein